MLYTKEYAIVIPNEILFAMTTIVINENSDEGRMLMPMIRAAQQSSNAVVSIRDDDAAGHIPGLSYTKEERMASVCKAMKIVYSQQAVGALKYLYVFTAGKPADCRNAS